jgi:hypothetical protein
MSEPSVEKALRDALRKKFTPDAIAGWIAELPSEARERILRDFRERPVKRTVRIVLKDP